ncbi:MAG TPA: hypothetical protein VGE25_02935 [Sediminibacterium sp.]
MKSSKDFGSVLNRHFCIDIENADEIFASISNKKKKFWEIVERILTQRNMYYDHYKSEKISNLSKGISAIRFLGNENIRIYCKEVSTKEGSFFIVCAKAIKKKVQKNDKRIDGIINSIVTYEYEIIE